MLFMQDLTEVTKSLQDFWIFVKKKKYYDNFKGSEFSPILEKGKPVSAKEAVPYLAGILCENLRICKAESYNMVEKNKDDKEVTVL